jgi:hypothetical protein
MFKQEKIHFSGLKISGQSNKKMLLRKHCKKYLLQLLANRLRNHACLNETGQ